MKLDDVVAQAQRTAIENALVAADGSVPGAAELLGRNHAALHRLMGQLGMKVPRSRRTKRRGTKAPGTQPTKTTKGGLQDT
jgi:DNA-binding NtrC family response regulator